LLNIGCTHFITATKPFAPALRRSSVWEEGVAELIEGLDLGLILPSNNWGQSKINTFGRQLLIYVDAGLSETEKLMLL
jgi:hypothetical protein